MKSKSKQIIAIVVGLYGVFLVFCCGCPLMVKMFSEKEPSAPTQFAKAKPERYTPNTSTTTPPPAQTKTPPPTVEKTKPKPDPKPNRSETQKPTPKPQLDFKKKAKDDAASVESRRRTKLEIECDHRGDAMRFLKYPHDATFGWLPSRQHLANGGIRFSGTIKAKNAFGAELTHEYTCEYDRNGNLTYCTIGGEIVYADEKVIDALKQLEQAATPK